MSLVLRKLHKYQDRRWHDRFVQEKDGLLIEQRGVRDDLHRQHEMQALDLQRPLRALDRIDRCELRSLETTWLKQQRIRARAGHDHMPPLTLELRPKGRPAAPHKAPNRHTSPARREPNEAFEAGKRRRSPIDLAAAFERAARHGGTSSQGERDSSGAPEWPYVLVHSCGCAIALPEVLREGGLGGIDLWTFLAQTFAADCLPSIDEARSVERRRAPTKPVHVEVPGHRQRLERLMEERASLAARHEREWVDLELRHLAERRRFKAAYLARARAVRAARKIRRPTGPVAVLGRITGFVLVMRSIRRRRDGQHYRAYRNRKVLLVARQHDDFLAVFDRHWQRIEDWKRQRGALEAELGDDQDRDFDRER